MNSVFLLWYIHAPASAEEDEILIGVYRSEDDARLAIQRLHDKPGFAKAPDGFHIVPYELNRDQWSDGFAISS